MTIDVIIPLYKPGRELFSLLDALERQTVSVNNIILMNTERQYLTELISEEELVKSYPKVRIFHLSKEEFDHGATRRAGVEHSEAEVFVMMTQDAIPADEHLLEQLTSHLRENVACAYARQLPREDCSVEECFTRSFNYPEQSRIKSEEDLQELGIKTFFCSDVCAAYRREIYDVLGGFVKRAIFNEDMIYAATVIRSGYAIAYEAGAEVFHSHNYTNGQQFHRNFDLGVSQAEHPDIFASVASEAEGKKLVFTTTKYLWKKHMPGRIFYFYIQCACKYAGYFLGKHYRNLPKKWILAMTSNREYWKGIS